MTGDTHFVDFQDVWLAYNEELLAQNHFAVEAIDLNAVAKKLDDDHYGLDEVKKRILEHMAVLKVSGNGSRATQARSASPRRTGMAPRAAQT